MRVEESRQFKIWSGSKITILLDDDVFLTATAPEGHEIVGLAGFQGVMRAVSPEELAQRESGNWEPLLVRAGDG